MPSPGPECTYGEPKKSDYRDRFHTSTHLRAGKVTERAGLQSAAGRISSLSWRIIVLF